MKSVWFLLVEADFCFLLYPQFTHKTVEKKKKKPIQCVFKNGFQRTRNQTLFSESIKMRLTKTDFFFFFFCEKESFIN